jgi:hypothetical protein
MARREQADDFGLLMIASVPREGLKTGMWCGRSRPSPELFLQL